MQKELYQNYFIFRLMQLLLYAQIYFIQRIIFPVNETGRKFV